LIFFLVQYAQCIKGKLKEHGYDDVELYFDIWRSMNGRFNQRQIDPRIDLLSPDVKWSPFQDTSWLQPLLTNLSDWRTRMTQIENELSTKDQNVLVTFVADFPGLFLENYIPHDLNTTIEVLEGEITVEMLSLKKNVTLNVGQNITVPSGDYHNGLFELNFIVTKSFFNF
jgi:vitamin K-dependent gamma-carboxylase